MPFYSYDEWMEIKQWNECQNMKKLKSFPVNITSSRERMSSWRGDTRDTQHIQYLFIKYFIDELEGYDLLPSSTLFCPLYLTSLGWVPLKHCSQPLFQSCSVTRAFLWQGQNKNIKIIGIIDTATRRTGGITFRISHRIILGSVDKGPGVLAQVVACYVKSIEKKRGTFHVHNLPKGRRNVWFWKHVGRKLHLTIPTLIHTHMVWLLSAHTFHPVDKYILWNNITLCVIFP